MIIPSGGGVNYALETGGNLATIAAIDFATQTTLALIKAKTDNLDITLTALKEGICDATTPKDLLDLWDELVAVNVDLAAIETLITSGNADLSTIAGVDFAEQTTLALIKTKTDNLDITITALKEAICDSATPKDLKDLWDKLDGLPTSGLEPATGTPVLYNVTMTTEDTEYDQALDAGAKQITFKVRDGTAFRYAWVTGKVATPTAPWLDVPSGSVVFLDKLNLTGKTLFFACATASKIMEIEVVI